MDDSASWLFVLADEIRDLIRQIGAEPFRKKLLEWKAVYDGLDAAVTSYHEKREEYFERASNDPGLHDSEAGPPEDDYVWATGSYDTEDGHIAAAAWVPKELGDEAHPEDPTLPLPLPMRLLRQPEEYVVLSAIHDHYVTDEKISPWPDTWDEGLPEEEYKDLRSKANSANLYFLLCREVPNINDADRPRLELALEHVKSGEVCVVDTLGQTPPKGRDKEKSKRIAVWLKKHLEENKKEYDRLKDQILSSDSNASKAFRDLFGPTNLARAFTEADGNKGDKKQVATNKTIIMRNELYKKKIQPLIKAEPPSDCPDTHAVDQRIDDILGEAGL